MPEGRLQRTRATLPEGYQFLDAYRWVYSTPLTNTYDMVFDDKAMVAKLKAASGLYWASLARFGTRPSGDDTI